MMSPSDGAISGTSALPVRYAIIVTFEVGTDDGDRFLELVRANAIASLTQEPRCLRFDVLTPIARAGGEVVLYEIYSDRAAFEAHLASAHFLEFDSATREMVTRKSVAEYAMQETMAKA